MDENEMLKNFFEERSRMYARMGIEAPPDPRMLPCLGKESPEDCRRLLSQGVDPDMTFKIGGNLKPAIHIAVERDSYAVVELLLKSGAAVDLRDSNGRTALLLSLDHKYKKISELLLAHRADPNLQDNNGLSPLHLSVKRESDEISELLIEIGADVSRRDLDGRTPLMYVRRYQTGRLDLMKLLLNNGAKADAVDQSGHSVLDHITSSKCTMEMIELLLQNGALLNQHKHTQYIYKTLISPDDAQKYKTLEMLLKYGNDVNSNLYGEGLLHFATSRRDAKAIQILLKHGADPNALNSFGVSPFHAALSNAVQDGGHLFRSIVFMLVDAGGRLAKGQQESGFPFRNFTKEENEFLFGKLTNPMTLKEQSRIATWKMIGSRTYDWENLKDQIPKVLYQYLQLADYNAN